MGDTLTRGGRYSHWWWGILSLVVGDTISSGEEMVKKQSITTVPGSGSKGLSIVIFRVGRQYGNMGV